jgi:hypothetical protein
VKSANTAIISSLPIIIRKLNKSLLICGMWALIFIDETAIG